MTPDAIDDLVTLYAVQEYLSKEYAPEDADPSIYSPWGIIHYGAEYKSGKCDRPD